MATTGRPKPDLIGGHVALDLVNTIAWRLDDERRRDYLCDFPALAHWCRRVGLFDDGGAEELRAAASEHPRLAHHALRDVCALRERLYDLLALLVDGVEPPGAVVVPPDLHVRLLDSLAHSRLIGPPMRWELTPHVPADVPRLVALQALDLLQTAHEHPLRRCDGPGCGWLFVDRTRSHSRRWCSSGDCGNRDRARRHYARHHDQPHTKAALQPSSA